MVIKITLLALCSGYENAMALTFGKPFEYVHSRITVTAVLHCFIYIM